MASAWLPVWVHAPNWGNGLSLNVGGAVGAVKGLWRAEIRLGTAILAGVGVSAVGFVVNDMYAYYARLPQEMRGTGSSNPVFYFLSGIIRLFRWARGLDGTSTAGIHRFVRKAKDEVYVRRFLGDGALPERRPPRPELVNQGIPHRQVPQVVDTELEEKLRAYFRSFADKHLELTLGPSRVEPNALALFLPTPQAGATASHPDLARSSVTSMASTYEFVHVHGGDNSLHLNLAPLDAAEAIEKGWAVRFPLAGCGGALWQPEGRVMVYAPRDESELEVVERLIEAGWEYMTATKKI